MAIFLEVTAILVRTNLLLKNQEALKTTFEKDAKQLDKFLDMGIIANSEYDEKLQALKNFYNSNNEEVSQVK